MPPMTTPPRHPAVERYERASTAVSRYQKAIAILRAHQRLSPELVRGILSSRNKAYTAVRHVPGSWLARTICTVLLVVLDFLSWFTQGMPMSIRRRVSHFWQRAIAPLWHIPKPIRVGWSALRRLHWIDRVGMVADTTCLIKRLKDLDIVLYDHADVLNQHAPQIPLIMWERLTHAPERDVFGLLLPPKPLPWRDRLDGVWEFLSIVLLAASFAILVDISARLFSSGADAKGIQAIIVPSLLTLLAGSGLTRTGREFLGRIFDNLGAPRHWRDEFIFGCILLLFISISQVWMQLPEVAKNQTRQGHQALCIGLPSDAEPCTRQLSKAETAYSLAIKLDPENTEAHYGLGRVYEALQLDDQAIAEYQLAVKGEVRGLSYEAYDRLARLYILNGKKDDSYIKAIALSKDGLDLLQPSSIVRRQLGDETALDIEYLLYKNLGWAHLVGGEDYSEAKTYLVHARTLINDRAAAHCLLAQVNEALNEESRGKIDWERCAAFAKATDRDEERWNGMARQRLTQLEYDALVKRGQLLLEKNQLPETQAILQEAIALLKGRAPAYCLLAQLDEQRQQRLRARTHWELCLEYSRQNVQDQTTWATIARDRLNMLRDRAR